MKIGFYLDNSRIEGADLRHPEYGNPGVGGTQYLFVSTPYYLSKYYDDRYELIIYAHSTHNLPENLNSVEVNSIEDALEKSESDKCTFFVFRPISDHKKGNFFKKLSRSESVKGIAWAHNTPDIITLNKLYRNKNLRCFLCVSLEQYDRLRDHPIIYKSKYIFNGFDVTNYTPTDEIKKSSDTVAYIGSLVPAKGFHWLAKAWPKVLENKPSAKLIVMGSGKLYDRNAKMGKWGIAEESYENNMIRPYLSNDRAEAHESVNFMGLVGEEKIEIMQKVDVGVINPSGVSENCPGSALEFQAAGTPVVSGAYRGVLDTVIHGRTGLLGETISDLASNIVYFLNNRAIAKEYGLNGIEFVKQKFNYEKICLEWIELFNELESSRKLKVEEIKQFPKNDYKFIREILRKLKKNVPVFKILPSFESVKGYMSLLKNKF